MRRVRLYRGPGRAVVGLGVAVGSLLISSSNAAASCAAPTDVAQTTVAFKGRLVGQAGAGTAGVLFKFDVETVDRGPVASPAVVDIAVDQDFTGPNGDKLHGTNSVSIGPAPIMGKRYHVEAYVGTDEAGAQRLYVSACGGKLELLAESTSTTATTTLRSPHHHSAPSSTARVVGFAVAGGGVVLIALAVGVARRRRRSP